MILAKEINEYLRQKFPFVQVDRILEIEYRKSCIALKNVTISEPCFLGHFPDDPILPGVLIIESMAQAGGFIFARQGEKQNGVIAAVDKVKFKKPVIPGDTMLISSQCIGSLGNIFKVASTVSVDKIIVATGEITYSFESKEN